MKKYTNGKYLINQDFDVSSLDYEKAKQYIPAIEPIARATKQCFFIFDYYKHNFFHINTKNDYYKNIPEKIENPNLYFNDKIFPEDLNFVYNIHERVFKYILDLEMSKRKNIFFHYKCRIKNNDENFVMTDVKLSFLEFDSNGNIWLVMFIIEKSKTDFFILPYLKLEDNSINKLNLNPDLFDKLTKTEQNIVLLMFEEKSNNEISEILKSRISTVKTHLQNIYLKVEVQDRFEFQKKILMKEIK